MSERSSFGNGIELHHGDALEVMRSIPDASVDAVITDPPYGIDFKSSWVEGGRFERLRGDREISAGWLDEAYRIIRPGSPLLCFTRWDVSCAWKDKISAAGFRIRSEVIWDRQSHGLGDLYGGFAPQHDSIWFATSGNGYRFPGERPKSVIYAMRVAPGKLVHPTEKPISLMRRLLRSVVKSGGVVLDPFAGSGSTLLAARCEGMGAIGIEIEREYFEIAKGRLEPLPLLAGTK